MDVFARREHESVAQREILAHAKRDVEVFPRMLRVQGESERDPCCGEPHAKSQAKPSFWRGRKNHVGHGGFRGARSDAYSQARRPTAFRRSMIGKRNLTGE